MILLWLGALGFLSSAVVQADEPVCRCTRELNPLCGINGQTYNNPCLAECAKVPTAYPGPCKLDCASCPEEWNPVCDAEDASAADGAITYASSCYADCNNATRKLPGNCKSLAGCACLMIWAPVCGADGKTYGDTSCAECSEVPVAYEGECEGEEQEEQKDEYPGEGLPLCACPRNLDPQCGADGETYDNPCIAKCAGVEIVSPGECSEKNRQAEPVMVNTWVKAVDKREDCGCPENGFVVCGKDGRTYPNECMAKCRGTEMESQGACGAEKEACEVCGSLRMVWYPVCVTRTTTGADGSIKNAAPKTFSNPCTAQCEGGATPEDWFYKGECRPRCDAYCYRKPTQPVCCGVGDEFPNPCWASCAGGYDVTTECTWGQCTGDRGLNMMAECLPGSPIAACIRDPCEGISCPENPDAVCVRNYCMTMLRYDLNRQLCAPFWYNPVTGNLAKECSSKPSRDCTPAGAMCIMDQSQAGPDDPKPCCEPFSCYAGDFAPDDVKYGDCYNPNIPFPRH